METAAEVQAALQEKGVELSEEEILGIRDLLCKVESGELPEELLEQVAGGSLTLMGVCAVVGMVATLGGMVYSAIRERW